MTVEISTLVTLGIAVAGLLFGMVNFVLMIVHIFVTKRESSELKQWQRGVERQLGRIEGKVEK